MTVGPTAKFGKLGKNIELYCREPSVNAFEMVIVIYRKVIVVHSKEVGIFAKLILILN